MDLGNYLENDVYFCNKISPLNDYKKSPARAGEEQIGFPYDLSSSFRWLCFL